MSKDRLEACDDSELEACETQLTLLKEQLSVASAAAAPTAPGTVDPTTILVIVETISAILKFLRERRQKP